MQPTPLQRPCCRHAPLFGNKAAQEADPLRGLLLRPGACPVVASDDEDSDGSDDEAEGEDEEDGGEDGQGSDEGEEAGVAGTGGEDGNRKRRREPGSSPRQRRRRSPGEREAARQAERAERLQRRKERAQVGLASVGPEGIRFPMAEPHGSGVACSRLRLALASGFGQVALQQPAARISGGPGRPRDGLNGTCFAVRNVPCPCCRAGCGCVLQRTQRVRQALLGAALRPVQRAAAG